MAEASGTTTIVAKASCTKPPESPLATAPATAAMTAMHTFATARGRAQAAGDGPPVGQAEPRVEEAGH